MRTGKIHGWFQATALGALALLLPGSGGVPCVPEGGSVDVPFPNPDFDAEAAKLPSGWTLVGKNAEAFEQDPGFDDDLGPATIGESVTTVTISNEGGDLKGPSGETGDGWPGRGDCFEVYVTWYMYFLVPSPTTFFGGAGTLGPDGFKAGGGGVKTSFYKIIRVAIESGVVEVCPC